MIKSRNEVSKSFPLINKRLTYFSQSRRTVRLFLTGILTLVLDCNVIKKRQYILTKTGFNYVYVIFMNKKVCI